MLYAELARANSNVLLDLSYTIMRYRNTSLEPDFRHLFQTLDQRICVGTDFPEFGPQDVRNRIQELSDDLPHDKLENICYRNIMSFLQLLQNLPPSEDNQSFFNMLIEKFWVDVLKFPREDLVDDEGNRLLLTQPGAASIFDTETEAAPAGGGAEDLTQVPIDEGGAIPDNAEVAPEDLASQLQELSSTVDTGGFQ